MYPTKHINLKKLKGAEKRDSKNTIKDYFLKELKFKKVSQLKEHFEIGKLHELYDHLGDVYNTLYVEKQKDNLRKKREGEKSFYEEKKRQLHLGDFADKHVSRKPDVEDVKRFHSSITETLYKTPANSRKGFESLKVINYSIPELRQKIKEFKNLSVVFLFELQFHQPMSGEYKNFFVQIKRKHIYNNGEILRIVAEAEQECKDRIHDFETTGSGWVFDKAVNVDVRIQKYKPLRGSAYIPLDSYINNKKCCVNIQNTDDKCLMYCVLYHFHQKELTSHPERVSHYAKYEKEFDFKGVQFPVKINAIDKIEQIINYGIHVWGYDKEHSNIPFLLHKSKRQDDQIMNLLYITEYSKDSTKSHYVYIKDINKILKENHRDKNGVHTHKASFVCVNCVKSFVSQENLDNHKACGCDFFEPQRIELPKINDKGQTPAIQFKNYMNKTKMPVAIYADFETFIQPFNEDKDASQCQKVNELPPCGYAFNVVSEYPEINFGLTLYRGENAAEHFVNAILKVKDKIKDFLQTEKEMIISPEQQLEFDDCTTCCICEKHIDKTDVKARDHDHYNGKYRGCAHSKCNRQLREGTRQIPVYFHNLKGFDGHLIIQGLKNKNFGDIDIIAQNFEKYMQIKFGGLRILDSFAFLSSSLDKLSSNLTREDLKHTLNNNLTDEQNDLIRKKGVYPYEYMLNHDKFEETELPPIEKFYSSLNDSNITQKEYEHAQKVWEAFNIKNLGEYHDLYLKTDVLLLSDVFETFRKTAMTSYGLDPANGYITLPSFSWDAMLYKTKIRLEQLTDIDMYIFCERGIRGGISMISHRYAEANNPYMKNYDPSKNIIYKNKTTGEIIDKQQISMEYIDEMVNKGLVEIEDTGNSYIIYLDANNLYGGAMSEKLPYGGFRWVENFNEDFVVSYRANGDKGIFVEVDLEYPEELHDSHNNYPLAPESRNILKCELSPYQLNQIETHKELHNENIKKLVPNLYDKKNYVCHIKNLQYYLKKGLKLKKVHRVLEFYQRSWLKEYIDFNTNLRKNAKNDFEKDFYKLMNNAVYSEYDGEYAFPC
jgi:hypothetical protein